MHGGIGDYTSRLVEALAVHGWDARVLTSSFVRAEDDRVMPRVRRWNWESVRQVKQALDESDSSIVHLQYQTGAYQMHPAINLLPRRLNGRHASIPFVTTFHDLLPPYLFPKAGPVRGWVTGALASHSDAVITTNERDLERLSIERRLGRRVTMIPIGSNLPDVTDVNREQARRDLGLEDGDVVAIGFFGFLTEDKGVEVLLQALAGRTWKESTSLVIIGGGLAATDIANRPYLEWFEQALKACSVPVIETGFLPPADAAGALHAMDVVVLPFRHGASLRRGTLVAAIRAGATVLTTDPESDESLAPLVGGETMWLVPPGDPDALRAGLATVIGDRSLRQQLATNARIRGNEFDWNAIAERHINLYENLIGRARGHDGAS
jgi:glycosyltransferase involved in cell wall biosynthesis